MKLPFHTALLRSLRSNKVTVALFFAIPLCFTLVLFASYQGEYHSHTRITNVRLERITPPAIDCQSVTDDGWNVFCGTDFQISFPEQPEIQKGFSQVTCRTSPTDSATFNLSVTRFSNSESLGLLDEQRLEQMCQSLIKRNHYVDTRFQTVVDDKNVVQEMVCKTKNGDEIDVWKLCLANGKLYAAAVIGHSDETDPEIRRFLDSFQVTQTH